MTQDVFGQSDLTGVPVNGGDGGGDGGVCGGDGGGADYLKPYQDEVRENGAGFNGTLWASTKSQRVRFAAMVESVSFAGKRVLDAGCGNGDFAAYLLENNMPYALFVGVDGLPAQIENANQRQLQDATFYADDFVANPAVLKTGRPQIITMSGTLNTMDEAMALTLINQCWQATDEYLIFNFLPTTCGPEVPKQLLPARRLNTDVLLTWAFSQTWSVVYRQDYFPNAHDGMIVMRK